MSLLSREDILKASDIKFEVVEVPEWGGSVRVKSMTGTERDDFESSVVSIDGKKTKLNTRQLRSKLVAICLVDEDGKQIFTENDINALSEKNAQALERVFEAAQRLAGLRDDDLEDMQKN